MRAAILAIVMIPVIGNACGVKPILPPYLQHTLAGYYHHRGQRWEKAARHFTKALDYLEFNKHLLSDRGVAYYNLNDFKNAYNDFQSVIDIDPQFTHAIVGRGLTLAKQGKWKLAIADFDAVLKLNASDLDCLIGKGYAYYHLNDYQNALDAYSLVIKADPTSTHALIGRGDCYCEQDKWAEAITDFTEAIRHDPKAKSAYFKRSWAMIYCDNPRLFDVKQALQDAEIACKLDEHKSPNYLELLALACNADSQFTNAVKWQQAAINAMDAKDPELENAKLRLKSYQEKVRK